MILFSRKCEYEVNFSIVLFSSKGINAEKKEAKAEKDEADKYQKLEQDLVYFIHKDF